MLNPFVEWLPDVAQDVIVISADDIEAEARGNLWTFALTKEQVAAISLHDVIQFAEQVTEARRASVIARTAGSMVLYWWHDTLAGQLCFSLVSIGHRRLPFRCKIVSAPNLEAVIEDWLGSAYLHGIPWSELSASRTHELAQSPVTRVWAVILP